MKVSNLLLKKLDPSRNLEILFLSQEYRSASEKQMLECFYDILTYYAEPKEAKLYPYSVIKQNEISLDIVNRYSSDISNKSLAQKLLRQEIEIELLKFRDKADGSWDRSESFAYKSIIIKILSSIGPHGTKLSKIISSFKNSNSLQDHWKLFIWPKSPDDMTIYPAFFYFLADALFTDKVLKKYNDELKKTAKKYPGVTSEVFDSLKEAFFAPNNKITTSHIERSTFLHSKTGKTLALVDMSSIETIAEIQKKMPLLNSSTAHKLIDYVLKKSQHDYFFNSQSNNDPFNIRFEGGITKLLNLISVPVSGKNTKMIKDILQAGQALILKTKHREIGGLWSYDIFESKGQKKSILTITLGNAFRPHYEPFKKSFIIPITNLPPTVGNRKYWGFQFAFHKYVIAEIVNNHRMNIINYGGAFLSPQKLESLAIQCGLPLNGSSGLKSLWEKWTKSDQKIFNEVKPNYYEINESEEELSRAVKLICSRAISGVKGKIPQKRRPRSIPLNQSKPAPNQPQS